MKKALILTVLLASVPVLGFSQTAFTVRNAAGWIEAVNGIRNGGNDQSYEITVTGTVSVPASAESTFGSVISITVTIEGNGTLSPSNTGNLLVIGKDQTIIAKDLTLKGRDANNASVVKITEGGTFRMEGKASVTGNKTIGDGGGVYVDENGTFTMQDTASVSGNTSNSSASNEASSGGGVYIYGGTFTMLDNASVSGNTSSSNCPRGFSWDYSCSGGGVYIDERGTFTMQGNASVSGNISSSKAGGNWVSYSGGGVFVRGGTFIMQETAWVSGNTSSTISTGWSCGGVYVVSNGTFTMQGNAKVSGNTFSSSYPGGGGVIISSGTFTIRDSATVSGNTSTSTTDTSYGGVYVGRNGTFTMQGGAVSGNTSNCAPSYYSTSASSGGGVYVGYEGTFTMQGGAVSGNTSNSTASSASATSGGGVYVNSGTFTMEGGTVSGNTSNSNSTRSATSGGGVHVNGGTFTMQGDASVSGNKTNVNGGGVFIASSGIFILKESASISGNTAIYKGGGVYVGYEGTFTKTGGTIYGDDVDQKLKNSVISILGHAVYEEKNKGWRNATAGVTMNPDSYGFWLNDGDVVTFPSDFAGTWRRSNFNNTLTLTENIMKSSSRDFLWVLQKISGNAYTLKRGDATNTMTITIRLTKGSGNYNNPDTLDISGDSGNGENNWNGTWRKQ